MQSLDRYARLMHEAHGGGADQRRLLRGLRDHGVAGCKRRRNLPREDRQREVPGADAGEDAAAVQLERIALASGARQQHRSEIGARAHRVVAAEVDRLAHLRDGVRNRPTALADDQRHKLGKPRLEEIADAGEDRRARARGHRVPIGRGVGGAGEGSIDMLNSGVGDNPDRPRAMTGVAHRARRALEIGAAHDRRRGPGAARGGLERCLERRQLRAARQIRP